MFDVENVRSCHIEKGLTVNCESCNCEGPSSVRNLTAERDPVNDSATWVYGLHSSAFVCRRLLPGSRNAVRLRAVAAVESFCRWCVGAVATV